MGNIDKPPVEVYRVVIELEDGILRVKPTENAIQTLGMLTLATGDIIAQLQHKPEEDRGGKIIIPKLRMD